MDGVHPTRVVILSGRKRHGVKATTDLMTGIVFPTKMIDFPTPPVLDEVCCKSRLGCPGEQVAAEKRNKHNCRLTATVYPSEGTGVAGVGFNLPVTIGTRASGYRRNTD